jgi:hypothetical protein
MSALLWEENYNFFPIIRKPILPALFCINSQDAFGIKLLDKNIATYPQSYSRLMWTTQKKFSPNRISVVNNRSRFRHTNCCNAIVSSKAIQTLDFARSRKVCGLFYACWRFNRFDAEWLGSTKIHLKGIEETRKSPHRQDGGLFHAGPEQARRPC